MATLNQPSSISSKILAGIKREVADRTKGVLQYYHRKHIEKINSFQREFAVDHCACIVFSDNNKISTKYRTLAEACEYIGIDVSEAIDIIKNKNGIYGAFIITLVNSN